MPTNILDIYTKFNTESTSLFIDIMEKLVSQFNVLSGASELETEHGTWSLTTNKSKKGLFLLELKSSSDTAKRFNRAIVVANLSPFGFTLTAVDCDFRIVDCGFSADLCMLPPQDSTK